jgi:hypothetical protein
MTEAEFDRLSTRVTQLEERAEARAKAWRTLRRTCAGLAIFLTVAAVVFLVTAVWLYPTARDFAQIAGFQLLITSLPLSLLAQVLRTH